ncbi:MAG: beta-CASP ribonuclease aCPSF1 [Nitrososphaerota archaeon]|nr:beta-CASP ribonuclease aCPSF1 [Nitrososphaerales archaeon]MDW8044803.1 beta-CASP ribonuclease aCPSF1 [Nitrososphaerota archaeon]
MQGKNSNSSTSLMNLILKDIPSEAGITRVEYEGPRIALYTKNPRFLMENNYIISDIVNTVKKRVVLRIEKTVRKPEEEAKKILTNIIPKEAGITNIFFDDALGEVIIEVKRPNLLLNNNLNSVELTNEIGWKIKVRKAPHITSSSMNNIYYTFKSSPEDRERIYRAIGERIFRPRLLSDSEITLLTLGGFGHVGRSSMLLETSESKVLIDCGIHPGSRNPLESYPRLDWADIELEELDAVIISHAHLDHSGFLPVLYKYGYDGPVYCSEPTLPLMVLLLTDFVKVASMQGEYAPYDMRDIREVIKHCITLPYGLVTDVSPDIKLVLNNAGHILGSSIIHLHIGEGAHNIIYTGDYKFERTLLFESAVWNYPRAETLITESTYGAKEDIMPSREDAENDFVNKINETLKEGGKVLIPVPAVGRAQEIMLVLDRYMRMGKLIEVPIFIEGMISEATAIHVAFPEYLAKDLRSKILEEDTNPFVSEYFTIIEHPSNREEALQEGPALIMATSGMLEGGPVLEYFKELATSDKNKILFVSYQINGTLGRRILDGAKEVNLIDENGKIKVVNIKCKVEKVEGFSGHSDYNQIVRFVAKLRPKLRRIIVSHGEKKKIENMAYALSKIFKIPTLQPEVQEAIKIR